MDYSQITAWIAKWQKCGGAERANYQLFVTELCEVLGVRHPDPTRAEEPDNAYVFEKNVVFDNGDGTRGTRAYDDTMLRARGQAEQYARNLPADEGRPHSSDAGCDTIEAVQCFPSQQIR